MTQFESLKNSNQFKFTCPLFNTETRMGACVQLRDLVWIGAKPPFRRGCQAAMRCGKCPAAEMVRRYCYSKAWVNDHHGSVTPKVGKLMLPILERIRPVMMRDNILDELKVPDNERMLLATANERIDVQMKTAPADTADADYAPRRATRKAAPAPKIVTNPSPKAAPKPNRELNHAAITGDLAAAISA